MKFLRLRRRKCCKTTLTVLAVFAVSCIINELFYGNLQERMKRTIFPVHNISKENGNNVARHIREHTTDLHSTHTGSNENNVTSNTAKRTTYLRSEHTGSNEYENNVTSNTIKSTSTGSKGKISNATENTAQNNSIVQQKALPFSKFRYPLDINFAELITNISETGKTDVKPINVYPFTYLKPMEDICKSTKEVYLLFLIKSAPENFDQRQAIRETWANKTYFKQDIIRHVFLLARTMNKTINDRLALEEGMYNDIVQMTYVNAYYNNTYKTIGGINWCVKYCPKAQFVMMVDDDFYVATDFLLDYLHGLPNSIVRSLFAGYRAVDHPQRRRKDKWYMSLEDYPFKKYPPFISAGAMIMSMDFVKKLQIAIPFTKKFKFDDVFIAIVAHKLGVKPIHLPKIYIIKLIDFKDKRFKTMVASHRYKSTHALRNAWYYHLQTVN
ncbi:beta-1,3-galactosyltransferase brn-like [Mizuhopecten yessoensis]|uniref:Hexosyltransferase n=1 Tax=Mizuhopecten yessoensis TaxID=6573 RepID=A0A210Q0Y1_MIZYE|nr:beta-1,3-galactosyltransferase brn-like [Mizuhopecten yessoensis]OWF42386.1 Beta-1,3-galactosyltransferase brn [Mizuhopecten yessoensis]